MEETPGTLLSILLLAAVVALVYLAWRRPFIGLAVLVAGMAFHNFVIMTLLGLGTPMVLVRIVQGWKEAVIAVLMVRAISRVQRMRREGRLPAVLPGDWIAIAFGILVSLYLVVPMVIHAHGPSLGQRLVAGRIAALLPILYFLGRIHAEGRPAEHARVAWILTGSAAAVGAFGVVELWLIPTSAWLELGANRFSSLLGFAYDGPKGLPPNFFQTLPDGTLLRRAVSFYLSPLGIAYTGLLVFPIAVALVVWPRQERRRRLVAELLLAFTIAGVEFSVTRLALLALAGEALLIALILRRRWAFGLCAMVGLAAAIMLFAYPHVGPLVDRDTLGPVGSRSQHPATITSSQDTSVTEHSVSVRAGVRFAPTHPLGQGLGGSVNRFGGSAIYGESAVISIFADLGWIGGALYLLLYLGGLYYGARALLRSPPPSILSCLPLVACVGGLALLPVTATSEVWGDFSVTFLFWWAAGWSASCTQGIVPTGEAPFAQAKRAKVAHAPST